MNANLVRRPGSILPLVAFSIVIMVIFVALAIDIGMMVLARNHAQIAADMAALAGVRVLDGKTADNNKAKAQEVAEEAAVANQVLSTTPSATVTVGTYYYDKTAKRFVHNPNDKPKKDDGTYEDEAWGAVQVSINSTQPYYFARVLGFTDYDVTAMATSVHRPRDMALVLDFSGSMRFGSSNGLSGSSYASGGNTINGAHNPDPGIPNFGHWASYQGVPGRLRRTTTSVASPYKFPPSNWTMDSSDSGPAIVKDYRYSPGTSYDTDVDPDNLLNAFHNPVPDDSTWRTNGSDWTPNRTIVTPMPVTDTWRNQTSTLYQLYGGDRWPCRNNDVNPLNLITANGVARNVADFLRNSQTTTTGNITTLPAQNVAQWSLNQHTTNQGHWKNQGDTRPVGQRWEDTGYDGVAENTTFKGYTLGPGYYGKTFFIWPPDPRYNAADPTLSKDWRHRFFQFPSTPNNRPDNNLLFHTNTALPPNNSSNQQQYLRTPSDTTFQVRYDKILEWIKQEPCPLPPNLRAGRVVFYKHIPDTVTGGSGEELADKLFWKNYIDYVLGLPTVQGMPSARADYKLYGLTNQAFNANNNVRIQATPLGPTGANDPPYMHYLDCPRSPLLHFWFGPLTMMDFISQYNRSWVPGTVHEAQSWQLKAGVNSALSDIEKNHPNDWVSLIYFSNINSFNVARVTIGKEYGKMKNALFFPFNLLDDLSDKTKEWRPYNPTTFADLSANSGIIPHADGGTNPEMAVWVAFNQFSNGGGFVGRKGAAKILILETDGVPNASANLTFNNGTSGMQNAYVTGLSNTDRDDATDAQRAVDAVARLCGTDAAPTYGYSGATKARAHGLAFGDLFDPATDTVAQNALTFLANVQKAGNTSTDASIAANGTTKIESYKVVTGTYEQRIDRLRTALERIMQSGVQVTLIKGANEY